MVGNSAEVQRISADTTTTRRQWQCRDASSADTTVAQRGMGQGNDGVTAHSWELGAG